MFLLSLLLSGVIALGAGAAEMKLTPEQRTTSTALIKLEEPKLASLSSEKGELYNCPLTSDMGDMAEDIRTAFLQIITAENNLNKQKRKFIASLKETYGKNCFEHEEAIVRTIKALPRGTDEIDEDITIEVARDAAMIAKDEIDEDITIEAARDAAMIARCEFEDPIVRIRAAIEAIKAVKALPRRIDAIDKGSTKLEAALSSAECKADDEPFEPLINVAA